MAIYRLLISVFALITLAKALVSGGFTVAKERLGGGGPRPQGPHIWLHAASNGELASALPVLREVQEDRPDLSIFVTSNTVTGVALARALGYAAVLAPLDLRHAVRRFLKGREVVAHITMESEIWPNRTLVLDAPTLVLGARMTESTAKGWAKLPKLAARVLRGIQWASAQDASSMERLLQLGLPTAAQGPTADLKAYYDPQTLPKPDPQITANYPRAQTWLAASTHEGEEDIILDAHVTARRTNPDLQLILAPRHPQRADEIAEMIAAKGLDYARRSHGDSHAASVLLADTMGEMPNWYRIAGRVFIAGTLTDRGGHTPYEPAYFGCALIHGPDTRNFTNAFAQLDAAKAALRVQTADELARALETLDAGKAQEMAGIAAQTALRPDTPIDGLVEALLAQIPNTK